MKQPTIFMLIGPSGVGKTTISKQLEKYFKIKSFTTDKIRRLKEFEEQYKKYRKAEKNFHWTFRKKLHVKLLELAKKELDKGKSVVLDATFSRRWTRDLAKNFAQQIKAKLVTIDVSFGKLTDEQIVQRFKDRLKKDHKAALPEVYFIYKKYYQAMTKPDFIINNDGTLAELRKKIKTMIKKIK